MQFTPIAGYVPSRPAIKYLIQQRDIEVWLAPIAATRVVVPFRLIDADADRASGVMHGDAIRHRVTKAARRGRATENHSRHSRTRRSASGAKF